MFLSIPFFQGDNCDNEHTKGEKLRPCNHCNHPLAFVWGCQKFTPERGNRLPWHGSAVNRITQYSSIVNASAGICRYGGSWAACAARFQKGILPAQIFQLPACAGAAWVSHWAFRLVCARPRFCRGHPSVPASPGRFKFREGGHSFAMRPRQQAPAVGIAQSLARFFPGAFRWNFPRQIAGFLRAGSARFFVFILSRLEPVENVSGLFSLPPYDYLITTTKENE